MYLRFRVKIPEDIKGISKKTIKGTTYVYYEHGRRYVVEKQYTRFLNVHLSEKCARTIRP